MNKCPKCGALVTIFSDEQGWYERCANENCSYIARDVGWSKPAYQHYTCAECGLELVVTELDKNFPDADGWILVEDEAMVELGIKPHWLCPQCQKR